MNIQEIGQTLLNELNEEVTKSKENTQLAKGAIHGVQLFFNRIQEEQMKADPTHEKFEASAEPRPISKKSKGKK